MRNKKLRDNLKELVDIVCDIMETPKDIKEDKAPIVIQTKQELFYTVNQLVEKYPFLTQGGVRHWLFNTEVNGFENCVRRIGRKILINEKLFLQWIDKNPISS